MVFEALASNTTILGLNPWLMPKTNKNHIDHSDRNSNN